MSVSRPLFFFFNDTATTEIYTLSLHDALPISLRHPSRRRSAAARPVPARHRDGAAGDRSRAGPRLVVRRLLDHRERAPEVRTDRVDDLGERLEAVPADERVAVR